MLVTRVDPEPGEADLYYDASTWVDVLEIAKTPTDIARIMAAQLRRSIDSRGLSKADAASILGIGPSTLSRNIGDEPSAVSRATARLIDERLPLLHSDFSMATLRDLYVLASDQEVGRAGPGAKDDEVANAAADSLLAGTTDYLARSGRCFASSALSRAPVEAEPIDGEQERLTYGFVTVSDPIAAQAVAIRLFESLSGDLGCAELLTVDHLMGRWDLCVKYKSPISIDADYVFDRLKLALREAGAFPHSTQGFQDSVRGERLAQLDPLRLGLASLVPVVSRVADPASSSVLEKERHYDEVLVRIPNGEALDSNRVTRVFLFVDFHAVHHDHQACRDLLTCLADISGEAQCGPGGLTIESINVGVRSAVVELTIGCGSMDALSSLNRAFERSINSRFTVQKYNMISYEHTNLWASARDQGEAGKNRVD